MIWIIKWYRVHGHWVTHTIIRNYLSLVVMFLIQIPWILHYKAHVTHPRKSSDWSWDGFTFHLLTSHPYTEQLPVTRLIEWNFYSKRTYHTCHGNKQCSMSDSPQPPIRTWEIYSQCPDWVAQRSCPERTDCAVIGNYRITFPIKCQDERKY